MGNIVVLIAVVALGLGIINFATFKGAKKKQKIAASVIVAGFMVSSFVLATLWPGQTTNFLIHLFGG